MSFNKTDKYGVPIPNSTDERAGLQQPKFTSRFRVQLRGFGTAPANLSNRSGFNQSTVSNSDHVLVAMVESFNKPSINFGTNEVTSFIGRGKYSGRPKTESFTLVLRDEITNTVISQVYNQVKMQTYKFAPVSQRFGDGSSYVKSIMLGFETKFDCIVETLDGRTGSTPLETWVFKGCFIENLESTGLSYEDDASIVKLTLQCQFDHFEIFQSQKVMFPRSYAALEGTPETAEAAAEQQEEEGFFDAVSGVAGDIGDSASDLFGKAKESFNSFIGSNEPPQDSNDTADNFRGR